MVVTVDNKPKSVDELSALFDEIDVGSNLDVEKSSDYGAASTGEAPRLFTDKVADVKAVLEPEPQIESKEEVPEPEPEPEKVKKTKPKSSPKSKSDRIQEAVENGDYGKAQDVQDESNPLGLVGDNLKAYTLIKQKYPQFQLYDESRTFREFYQYKVRSLKNLLTQYGLLPLSDMRKEVEHLKLDSRLGPDLADPVSIGQRMDESIANRGRLASLLASAQMQIPAWRKTFEWLNSKVSKDYDVKGAWKREGLALEHNDDMKDYYTELQGFVDAATTIDSFLKSQHDSYSRQLSCVDMREKVGVMQDTVKREIEEVSTHATPPKMVLDMSSVTNSELDGLDTLESGTVIDKVPKGGLIERDFPGAAIESEFLDGIG